MFEIGQNERSLKCMLVPNRLEKWAGMRDADQHLFQAYERAAAQLEAAEEAVHQRLTSLFEPDASPEVTVRMLAFLEGLRKERDEAWGAMQQAEQDLLDQLLSRLRAPPDPVT
jgi:hypothetical protein